MEKTSKMGGKFKVLVKNSLQSSNFTNYTSPVPKLFYNSILVKNIICIIFQFLMWDEREIVEFHH